MVRQAEATRWPIGRARSTPHSHGEDCRSAPECHSWHRSRAGQWLALPRHRRRADEEGVHRLPYRRLRERAGYGAGLPPGACGAPDGCTRRTDASTGALDGGGTFVHDPVRAWRGAAQQGRGHGSCVDQPRPRTWPARHAVLRVGLPDRARQRPGWPRTWPEGRPTSRLSTHREPGPPRACRQGVGRDPGVPSSFSMPLARR
jgi:hypothetical protein